MWRRQLPLTDAGRCVFAGVAFDPLERVQKHSHGRLGCLHSLPLSSLEQDRAAVR